MPDEQPEIPDEPTLSELFARDPAELTNSDTSRIVARLREARRRFDLAQEAKKTSAKPRSSKAKVKDIIKLDESASRLASKLQPKAKG